MIDTQELVRNVATHMASSHDFSTSFFNTIQYLKTIMHIDEAVAVFYNRELHAMETFCAIGKSDAFRETRIEPLPKEIPRNYHFFEGDVYCFTKHSQGDMPDEYYKSINIDGKNDIAIKINYEDTVMGFIILRGSGDNVYTEMSLEPFKAIQPILTMAFVSTLRMRKLEIDNERLIAKYPTFKYNTNRTLSQHIACENSGLSHLLEIAKHVAQLNTTVLITGETGVGKDVFANYIHNSSAYKRGPLIKINCGAIPETLIDSELFGYEKGAFTGADTQKKGKFELAGMGTLFLDEIGELPLASQVKLLRAIQFKEIERLGGTKTIKINTRIICATNKDLDKMVEEGTFRQDLFYRINVLPLEIPPVRARRDDIPELLNFLVKQKCTELGYIHTPELCKIALKKLIEYQWPGNVREMENIVERELILNYKQKLDFKSFLKEIHYTPQPKNTKTMALDNVILNHINTALHHTNGIIHGNNGAAKLLGLNPSTLRSMIKRLNGKMT